MSDIDYACLRKLLAIAKARGATQDEIEEILASYLLDEE